MATLTMVKTVCCESYKNCGKRCSLCPHRPENQEALEAYRAATRRYSLCSDAALCGAASVSAESSSSNRTS
jgi:hypothetical protein